MRQCDSFYVIVSAFCTSAHHATANSCIANCSRALPSHTIEYSLSSKHTQLSAACALCIFTARLIANFRTPSIIHCAHLDTAVHRARPTTICEPQVRVFEHYFTQFLGHRVTMADGVAMVSSAVSTVQVRSPISPYQPDTSFTERTEARAHQMPIPGA